MTLKQYVEMFPDAGPWDLAALFREGVAPEDVPGALRNVRELNELDEYKRRRDA